MKIKRIYILSSLLIILLVTLGAVAFLQFRSIFSLIADFRESNFLGEKSTVNIFLEDEKLKANFKISDRDRLAAFEFSKNFGTDNQWLSGVSLDLDEGNRQKLSEVLPVSLNLNFSPKKVSFRSNSLNSLRSSLAGERIEFATHSASSVQASGKLSLRSANIKDFSLSIKNPEPLLKYATASRQINLSKKVLGMFPILGKISTIKIEVNGKHIEGFIDLK